MCQKGLHRMSCFELVCRNQGLDSVFVWLIYQKGTVILPFWLSNFSMLPWCLIHPSRVLLAESSNIRYTQCFYITVYPFPFLLWPCVHSTFFLFEGFKNLLLHGDAYKYSVYNQEVEMWKWGCRSRTEQEKQVLSLSTVTWALQPTQIPCSPHAGGHSNIYQVYFGSLAPGVGVLSLGPCFPGKAGGCRSPSRLHQPPLLIRLSFQSCWFL